MPKLGRLRIKSLCVKYWYIPSIPNSKDETNSIYTKVLTRLSVFKVSATTKNKNNSCKILQLKVRLLIVRLELKKMEAKQMAKYAKIPKLK